MTWRKVIDIMKIQSTSDFITRIWAKLPLIDLLIVILILLVLLR